MNKQFFIKVDDTIRAVAIYNLGTALERLIGAKLSNALVIEAASEEHTAIVERLLAAVGCDYVADERMNKQFFIKVDDTIRAVAIYNLGTALERLIGAKLSNALVIEAASEEHTAIVERLLAAVGCDYVAMEPAPALQEEFYSTSLERAVEAMRKEADKLTGQAVWLEPEEAEPAKNIAVHFEVDESPIITAFDQAQQEFQVTPEIIPQEKQKRTRKPREPRAEQVREKMALMKLITLTCAYCGDTYPARRKDQGCPKPACRKAKTAEYNRQYQLRRAKKQEGLAVEAAADVERPLSEIDGLPVPHPDDPEPTLTFPPEVLAAPLPAAKKHGRQWLV